VKMVEVRQPMMRIARGACHAALCEDSYWDLDWVESKVSEIIWHNIHWPLQREIEDERQR